MLLIPAIALKDGQCVRARPGGGADTEFSADPLATAERWVAAGARRLHVVDLDGAASGTPVHGDTIADIVARFPDLVVQVGGGIRDEDAVEHYLGAGVDYVIIGTRAVRTPHFVRDLCIEFGGHIIVGLDARGGKVVTDGWSKLSNHDVVDLARHFERDGVEAIVFTDIDRDGSLTGPNVEATAALAREITIPVIASGGIGSLDHVRALCALHEEGIQGAVVGRALYEGRIEFDAAQQLVDSLLPA